MGTGRDLFARRKNGSEFPVEIGLNPIETAAGVLVLSAIVDITQRKADEQALRESEHRARALAAIVEFGRRNHCERSHRRRDELERFR